MCISELSPPLSHHPGRQGRGGPPRQRDPEAWAEREGGAAVTLFEQKRGRAGSVPPISIRGTAPQQDEGNAEGLHLGGEPIEGGGLSGMEADRLLHPEDDHLIEAHRLEGEKRQHQRCRQGPATMPAIGLPRPGLAAGRSDPIPAASHAPPQTPPGSAAGRCRPSLPERRSGLGCGQEALVDSAGRRLRRQRPGEV